MLCIANRHERDDSVLYKTGYFKVDGKMPDLSVSKIIHATFPFFDAQKIVERMSNKETRYPNKTDQEIVLLWESNRKTSCDYGHSIHSYIDAYITGLSPELGVSNSSHIQNFFEKMFGSTSTLRPYRSEWPIYGEYNSYVISCIPDLVARDTATGEYHLFEWKTCKTYHSTSPYKKWCTLDFMSGIEDTKKNRHSLQMHLYRRILQDFYSISIPICNMHIINFPEDDPCEEIAVNGTMAYIIDDLLDNLDTIKSTYAKHKEREAEIKRWARKRPNTVL